MMVKYWREFYYPVSDDLTVFDDSLLWAVFFSHRQEVFFGTNRPRVKIVEED